MIPSASGCPGCSTGEEVYSLAILMREHLDGMSKPPKVQLFATDIDEPALTVARAGKISRAIAGRRVIRAQKTVLLQGRCQLRDLGRGA